MNGIEHRIAGFPEADGRDNIPVAVELEDAGVFGIVVGAANSDVKETIGIGVNAKDAPCRLSVLCASPLPLELANPVEQLKARVFAVGDQDVGTAGHEHEPVRITKLTLARSLLTPFLQPLSVAVEERDAAVHIAVRDIKGSVRTDGNVGGLIEMRGIPCSDAWFPKREDELAIVCELENLL